MNTLQQQWASFRSLVVSKSASPVQLRETEIAFYAGAQAFFNIQTQMGDMNLSEEAACAMLEGLVEEIEAFSMRILQQGVEQAIQDLKDATHS